MNIEFTKKPAAIDEGGEVVSNKEITMGATLSNAIKFLTLAILLPIFCGCRSLPPVKVTQLVPGSQSTSGRPVEVIKQDDRVAQPYEVLGVVSALGLTGEVAIKGKAVKQMQQAASAIGADALIGYYEDVEGIVSGANWASALAVRFVPEAQAVQHSIGNYVVAIPHVLLDESKEKKAAEGTDKWSRKLAKMILASKGYYAVEVDHAVPENLADGLNAMDPSGLEKYGGAHTDLILALQFVETKKSTVLIRSGQSNTIELAMYSKSAKKVTWQNVGEGAASAGWIVNLVPNATKVMSVRVALDEAFKTLPDISTETKKKKRS